MYFKKIIANPNRLVRINNMFAFHIEADMVINPHGDWENETIIRYRLCVKNGSKQIYSCPLTNLTDVQNIIKGFYVIIDDLLYEDGDEIPF